MLDGLISYPALGQKIGGSSKGPLLSVDRLTIVFDVPQALRAYVHAAIIGLEKQEIANYHEYGVKMGRRGDYKSAIIVLMPGDELNPWSNDGVLVQVAPRKASTKNFVRMELNPNRTGPGAFARVQELLDWAVTGIELSEALTAATVTRIDIAIDIHGPRLDDYLIEALKKRIRTLYVKNGQLSTEYLGKRQNFLCIYDKGAEQGLGPADQPWLRMEWRGNPFCNYCDLATLTSPFASIQVYDVLSAQLPLKYADQRAFLDSCQKRGLRNAVRVRPSTERSLFTKNVRSKVPGWWNPTEVWQQWPGALTAALGPYAPDAPPVP